MNNLYAGIGARKTPRHILTLMFFWAHYSAQKGFVCSTGAANGADQSFANGALDGYGRVQLHLPWGSYNRDWINTLHGSVDEYVFNAQANPEAIEILKDKDVCSYFDKLKRTHLLLHGRNYMIIHKAAHVVCWSPNGAPVGGTGIGIKIANKLGIPVYNLGLPNTEAVFRQRLLEHGYNVD